MSIRKISKVEKIWDIPNGNKMFSINDKIIRVEDKNGLIIQMPGAETYIQEALPLTHRELKKLIQEYQFKKLNALL